MVSSDNLSPFSFISLTRSVTEPAEQCCVCVCVCVCVRACVRVCVCVVNDHSLVIKINDVTVLTSITIHN